MKHLFSVLFVFFGSISVGFSQNYVDTEFQIKTETDIMYGSSVDVAGNMRNLTMDMSYPTNDSVKSCGRPSMRLTRPDLGSYRGSLNPPIQNNYTIRGVGNFYGGIFDDFIESHSTVTPVLYAYHQPNDLVVPFGYSRVYAGFNTCAMSFPFNCQGIINRPLMYGSKGIINLIDSAKARGNKVPEYLFEPTNNTANCATQIANPSTAGHAFDNFTLRRANMAKYFATAIDTCQVNGVPRIENQIDLTISPNPLQADQDLHVYGYLERGSTIHILDMNCKLITYTAVENDQYDTAVPLSKLNQSGIYIVRVTTGQISTSKRIIVL